MGPAESWRGQRRSVRRLALRAGRYRQETAALRRRLRARIARFGEPRLVAWAFLTGLVWASARPGALPSADSGKFMARFAGALLWGWRLAHRVHATGVALGLERDCVNVPARGVPSGESDGGG